MKIGIITYHKAHNYGALLQAVATRYWLTKEGHEVSFIDYWPIYHDDIYTSFSICKLLRAKTLKRKILLIKKTLLELRKGNKIKIRREVFNLFINKYITPFCAPFDSHIQYEVVLYGSDQIWRRQNHLNGELNPVYFAQDDICTRRKVAYAASMGEINVNDRLIGYMKQWLSSFNSITVREDNLRDFVTSLGYQSDVVVDPTLMLTAKDWDLFTDEKRLIPEKYVLYYKGQEGAFDDNCIVEFAKKKSLKLVAITSSISRKIEADLVLSEVGPSEFINLIKNSEYVFTSSFHGLAFSVIYEKVFYASFTSRASRAQSILSKLDINEVLLPPYANFVGCLPKVKRDQISPTLQKLREESKQIIINLLNK